MRPFGAAYEKPQSAYGLCAVFLRHIFAAAKTAARFLYRSRKNVIYNRNVKRNAPLNFWGEKDGFENEKQMGFGICYYVGFRSCIYWL
jgi:hypothetical protein